MLGVGIAVGCALTAFLVIVAIGLVTGSGAPLTSWPGTKPSHREAAPREHQARHQSKPSPSVKTQPSVSPSGTRPATHNEPAATHPATTAPANPPGRGHAYGLSKAPHPKKP